MKEFFDGDILEGQYFNASKNGSKFFVDEDGKRFYISRKESSNALHKDRVKVELIRLQNKTSLNAVVISVLERTAETLVGTLDKTDKTCFFIPDLGGVDFHIRREYVGEAKNGDRIKVELLKWPKNKRRPEGKIVHVFGKTGEHEAEIQSIISKFDVQEDFPEKVLREANAIPLELDSEEIKKRSDLRRKFTFTIDGEDAKDLDDAISFKKNDNNSFEIGIHIADVSHYVKKDSELDKEAFCRATSVYLVDRVVPMLPRKLSNEICSLNPNEDKLCFSVVFTISDSGDILDFKISETIINSDYRFTYGEVQDIIDNKKDNLSEKESAIKTLHRLSKIYRNNRIEKGAMTFSGKQPKFILDENKKIVEIKNEKLTESHNLIEEFMLLTNKTVSTFMFQKKQPIIFRVHDKPKKDKLEELSIFVNKLNIDFKVSDDYKKTKQSLRNVLEILEYSQEKDIVTNLIIRSMSKAKCETVNIGHYGLGESFMPPNGYSWFTSPIKRFADLVLHRQVKSYLKID